MKRKAVIMAAFLISMLLTGCKSIILDADLDKATVKDYTVPPAVPVPKDKAEELSDAMNHEKYSIGGTEAFYILQAHRPAPEQILDFKVLDLIDGETTIYAYQAIQSGTSESGLGAEPESGKAQDSSSHKVNEGQSSKKMATILMSYNTKKKTYKVFFHQLDDYHPASKTDGENSNETSRFFAQKVGTAGHYYFFFYDGIGRGFDQDGKVVYEKDIKDILDYNASRYGGENAVLTLTNVVADENFFMYVTMNIEKGGSTIDENTTEDDLEEEDNGVVQLLYSCFELNIGEPDKASLSEDEKSYFVSENENYEEQVRLWKTEVEGKTFEVNVDHEPSMGEIYSNSDVPSLSKVKRANPDTYGVYRFFNKTLNIQLYHYNKEYWPFWPWCWLYPHERWEEVERWADLSSCNPSTISTDQDRKNKIYVGYIPDSMGNGETGTKYLFAYGKYPTPQTSNSVKESRTYTVKWNEKKVETATDSEGKTIENTVTVEKTAEVTEEAVFTKSYETRFKGDTYITWSKDVYTSDMIAPSAGSGVIRYGTTDGGEELGAENWENGWKNTNEDKAVSFASWDQEKKSLKAENIEGRARNGELVSVGKGSGAQPCLLLFTSKGISLQYNMAVKDSHNYWIPSSESKSKFIKNTELNFKVDMEDSIDNYNGTSIEMCSSGNNVWLYLAGENNGLVKYNVSASEASKAKAGQVSPYPYYAVWMAEDEKSCYAIGYETDAYPYDLKDLCRAKLYTVDLYDSAAASNLVTSAITKDPALKASITSGNTAEWNQMLKTLGISNADLKEANIYKEFLMDGEKKKESAILKFYTLAGITLSEKGENEIEKLRNDILNCRYPSDIEELMAALRPELAGKASIEPPKLSGMEILESDYQEQTESSSAALTDDEVKKRAEEDQKKVLNSRSDISKVIKALREAAHMTESQWNNTLSEMAYDLQTPETLTGFYQARAVRQFALMAEIPVQSNLEEKIRACRTKTDLEKLMAEYHLDAVTLAALESVEGTESALQDKAQAEKELDKAIEACKKNYIEHAYTTDSNGNKVYLKNTFSSTWTGRWQKEWDKQIEEILKVYEEGE